MSTENAVRILIQFNGKEIEIPVNPEKLSIAKKASNTDINVLGIGPATRKGEPGLISTKIKSFFPSINSNFYNAQKHISPQLYIDFINEIWNAKNTNNNVAKIITVGLEKNLNMFFVINNFDYDFDAGDDDVGFELDIKEYRAYGVKLVNYSAPGMANARVASPALSQGTSVQSQLNTYVVQSGDCLWNITKACCGDGSRYNELYNLNREIIGNSPNSIKPGQILTLPNGWATPTKVVKLQNVSKKNPPSTGTSNNNNIHEQSKQIAQTLATAKKVYRMDKDGKIRELTPYNNSNTSSNSGSSSGGGGHRF